MARRTADLVVVLLVAVLSFTMTGCAIVDAFDFRDTPSEWTQSAPVQMVANGEKIVFKSAS